MAARANVGCSTAGKSREWGTGSPGSVWVLQLRSAGSDPGPIERTTPGADHLCGLCVLQGQSRLSARHG